MIKIEYSEDRSIRRAQKFGLYAVAGIGAALVFILLFGLLLQWLWNAALVPAIGVGEVSFWQAVGVLILAKLFFGFGSGDHSRSGRGKRRRGKQRWLPDGTDAKSFKAYWEAQGRAEYEAFVARDQQSGQD